MTTELSMTELGRRLGISTPMVSRLHKRGMPLDAAGAIEWRRQNLSPLHTKGRRIDGNTGLRRGQRPRPLSSAALLELAHDIAAIMDDGDDALLAEGAPYLRGVLVRMDDATLAQVRLSVRVWDELMGEAPQP